jgi:hypothetical protein
VNVFQLLRLIELDRRLALRDQRVAALTEIADPDSNDLGLVRRDGRRLADVDALAGIGSTLDPKIDVLL